MPDGWLHRAIWEKKQLETVWKGASTFRIYLDWTNHLSITVYHRPTSLGAIEIVFRQTVSSLYGHLTKSMPVDTSSSSKESDCSEPLKCIA